MGNSVSNVTAAVKNNKYKVIALSVFSAGGYVFYRKYLKENIDMMKEIYNKMKELEGDKKPGDKVSKYLEGAGATNLIQKLLDEVKTNLDSTFHLSDLYEKIKSAPNEQKRHLWGIFKNLAIVEFYCSIFINRILLILIQTEFLLIDKLKIKNDHANVNIYFDIYNSLLTDLWTFTKNFITHTVSGMESKLSDITNNIHLNEKYNFRTFIPFVEKIKGKVETVSYDTSSNEFQLDAFKFVINQVENNISDLEKCEYSPNTQSLKVEIHLDFFKNLYDIITSNLFQTVLVNGLEYDFRIISDLIEMNFTELGDGDHGVSKIITFLVKIKNQILDKNNSIFLLKNYKENSFSEQMKEFLNIISA